MAKKRYAALNDNCDGILSYFGLGDTPEDALSEYIYGDCEEEVQYVFDDPDIDYDNIKEKTLIGSINVRVSKIKYLEEFDEYEQEEYEEESVEWITDKTISVKEFNVYAIPSKGYKGCFDYDIEEKQ